MEQEFKTSVRPYLKKRVRKTVEEAQGAGRKAFLGGGKGLSVVAAEWVGLLDH